MMRYKIADLVIELDCEKKCQPDKLQAFSYEGSEKTDLHWKIQDHDFPIIPESMEWTDFSGFLIGRFQNRLLVSYPDDMYLIRWIVYEDDFSGATFYYNKGSLHELKYEQREELSEYLFSFFREAFFLGVLYKDGISIHSASIVYRDKGVVFSASSGTGKSTHTNRWNEIYQTPILDGDVTVCRCLESGIYVYGLPWSGTSGLYLNQKVELEALVFLRQGSKNKVIEMPVYNAFQELFSRSFTPLWDAGLMEQRVKVTEKIIGKIPQIYLLECLPDPKAVEIMKEAIDQKFK